jgi:hypothetical protein
MITYRMRMIVQKLQMKDTSCMLRSIPSTSTADDVALVVLLVDEFVELLVDSTIPLMVAMERLGL